MKKLKSLSVHCSFGTFLHEAWRDKFVCGIRSQAIKRKLLSMDRLTFDIAYSEALSMELAEGQLRSMSIENSVSSVAENLDKIAFKKSKTVKNLCKKSQSKNVSQKSGLKWCHRCGVRKHDPEVCPAKDWDCFKCQKKGHTSRVCRKVNVNTLEELDDCESSQDEDDLVLGFLSSIQDKYKEKPVHINLEVKGKPIIFEIDTGACRTVMHIKDYRKYLSDLNLFNVKYDLKVLTGDGVKIIGELMFLSKVIIIRQIYRWFCLI